MLRQYCAVAIHLVDLPWRDDIRAAPLRRITETAAKNRVLRCDVRDHTVRQLCFAHVVGDFGIECRHIEIVHQATRQQVRALQPAELLAMRTVRQYALEIAFNGGLDQFVNPVHKGIGAGEHADRLRRGMNKLRGQLDNLWRGVGFMIGSLDLEVARAVIEEARHPCFSTLAFQGIGVISRTSTTALRHQTVAL